MADQEEQKSAAEAAPGGLIVFDAPGSQALATVSQAPQAALVAAAVREVEAMVVLAKRFPRDEAKAYARAVRTCKRITFAKRATYAFPRGEKKDPVSGNWGPNIVSGPSVYLAREIAKLWENMGHGIDVLEDNGNERVARAWARDYETNTGVAKIFRFKKLIQRVRKDEKGRKIFVDGKPATEWVEPDERDLRELTNRLGALEVRGCILQLIPADVIEDLLAVAAKAISDNVKADPQAAFREVVVAFDSMGVSVDDLDLWLGHKAAQSTPAEIVELRGLYQAIKEGAASIAEISARAKEIKPEKGKLSVAQLRERVTSTAPSETDAGGDKAPEEKPTPKAPEGSDAEVLLSEDRIAALRSLLANVGIDPTDPTLVAGFLMPKIGFESLEKVPARLDVDLTKALAREKARRKS